MKRFPLLFTFFAAAFILAHPSVGRAETGAREVAAAVEQAYAGINDIQGEFTQRTAIQGMKREQTGGGELFIRKVAGSPAMFRFNYAKPPQQIVSNGKTVWLYQPEAKQVIVSDLSALFREGSGATMNYLADMGHLSRDFSVSFSGEGRDKKGNWLLELVPKKKSQVMKKLVLTVSSRAVEAAKGGKAEFPLVATTVHDAAGNRTTMELAKIRINRGLSASLFTFKTPKGVEVIKQ